VGTATPLWSIRRFEAHIVSWVHEHRFERRDGGTLMRDRVNYEVTGGALIQRFLVAPDLKRIFQFRKARLNSIFGVSHD
jgi:ligand-binding SRPBCC domain-containing protein